MIISMVMFCACASSGIENMQKQDERFGNRETLNYEYTNGQLVPDLKRTHFLINTHIDAPVIISIRLPAVDLLRRSSLMAGSAIVRITSSRDRNRR